MLSQVGALAPSITSGLSRHPFGNKSVCLIVTEIFFLWKFRKWLLNNTTKPKDGPTYIIALICFRHNQVSVIFGNKRCQDSIEKLSRPFD